MKKRGFTLIELLAVIVVLAIIALIAAPIVMNTIKSAKKGAAERGADNYVKEVETSLMEYRLETGESLADGEYKITSDGNLCKDKSLSCDEEDQIKIEMNGTKPSGGSIVIENGQVKKENSSMKVGDYTVTYDTDNKTFVAEILEILCTKDSGVDLSNLEYGDKFTCELGDNDSKIFYVLETKENKVSLIMNKNIDSSGLGTTSGNTVAWCKSGDEESSNVAGPIEYLKSSTKSWTKLKENQISLPSGQQIATAAGDTEWTAGNWSHIETLPFSWLYENLNASELLGYWTSTQTQFSYYLAWYVEYDGDLNYGGVNYDDRYGVRPVITISKAQLS